ncbi:MAG: hypothetical protein LBH87_03660 [Coriobacteriales bacterium]|jgi:hypothetical protein|nr:hypothetical protein [Coriobacteriales bacterium]
MPKTNYIVIPEVSSERRKYLPCAILSPEVFVSNKLWVMTRGSFYEFGIISSQIHAAWTRTVTGRLKSDYQYSGAVVYNNFVWPNPNEEQRVEIEKHAQAVIDTRNNYPESSLADMYDPDNDFLYPDLMAVHKALDHAVEQAYGVSCNGDEEKIVAHLFKLSRTTRTTTQEEQSGR